MWPSWRVVDDYRQWGVELCAYRRVAAHDERHVLVTAQSSGHGFDPNRWVMGYNHLKRMNLNLMTHVRQFTRLTNAFSKSLKRLQACISLFVAWYPFCRIHQTLRATSAIQEGLAYHQWTVQELLGAATEI